MSRMTVHLATAALIALAPAAMAGERAPAQTQAQAQPPQAAARQPASAQVRATYDRTDALTRSVFWAQEQEINPADPVAGVKLAQALRELGRYDQAATTAETTLTVQPTNLDAMLELGRAHIARGQAFYSVAPLERARDQAPRDWRPWSLLGVAYEQVRRFDDAHAAWNQALALSPDNPDVLTNAAMAAITHGDAAGAEALLRRAAAQPGATPKVRQNLAMALGLQGKMGEAEQILRRELPPDQAERNLAWLRARAGAAGAPSAETARTWGSLQGG